MADPRALHRENRSRAAKFRRGLQAVPRRPVLRADPPPLLHATGITANTSAKNPTNTQKRPFGRGSPDSTSRDRGTRSTLTPRSPPGSQFRSGLAVIISGELIELAVSCPPPAARLSRAPPGMLPPQTPAAKPINKAGRRSGLTISRQEIEPITNPPTAIYRSCPKTGAHHAVPITWKQCVIRNSRLFSIRPFSVCGGG